MFLHTVYTYDKFIHYKSVNYTVFPRITAWGDSEFFRTKGGRLFEEGDYFKYMYVLLTGSCALISILLYPITYQK